VKVEALKQEEKQMPWDNVVIRREYLKKFKKEVDFHHKIAYRFERAYRLGKKDKSKLYNLNIEIINLLSEYSDYVFHDPISLFYCLYFCIYFNNSFIVEFLRTLIEKLPEFDDNSITQKFSLLLHNIDTFGLDRIRKSSDAIN
jgi:hypothetical protein